MPDNTQNLKILVIRFSSIGDIVLTTPVIRMLKTQHPSFELHFLTKTSYLSIVETNPYIDKVYCIRKDTKEIITSLKSEKYDYIIDLHKNLRTAKLKKQLKVKSFSFDKLNIQKWLYVNFKINKLPNIHIVDRYLATISSFGIKNDGKGLDFFIPKKDEYHLEIDKYVVIVLGATHFTKRIPIHKLKKICNNISTTIVLIGGKDVEDLAVELEKMFQNKIVNLCGKININQSASVIKQCEMVVTPDTGMMHIAAAFNKRIISVWGNTCPEFGMYPYFANSVNNEDFNMIVERKDLGCRPCSKIGFDKCPKGHFDCMGNDEIDKILYP